MLIALDGLSCREWLRRYFERRILAANKMAKYRLSGSTYMDESLAAYAEKNEMVNLCLRLGLASVAVDDSCNPTDVSIRFGDGRRPVHIPASQLEADIHEGIVAEASALAGIEVRTA